MNYFKLKTSFFESNKIKAIRSCKNGDVTVLVYLMLVAIAVNCENDGAVMLCDDIALTDKIMAAVLGVPSAIVVDGLKQLVDYGFICLENDVYQISDYDEFVCTDKFANRRKQGAERQQRYVENKKIKANEVSKSTQIALGELEATER